MVRQLNEKRIERRAMGGAGIFCDDRLNDCSIITELVGDVRGKNESAVFHNFLYVMLRITFRREIELVRLLREVGEPGNKHGIVHLHPHNDVQFLYIVIEAFGSFHHLFPLALFGIHLPLLRVFLGKRELIENIERIERFDVVLRRKENSGTVTSGNLPRTILRFNMSSSKNTMLSSPIFNSFAISMRLSASPFQFARIAEKCSSLSTMAEFFLNTSRTSSRLFLLLIARMMPRS